MAIGINLIRCINAPMQLAPSFKTSRGRMHSPYPFFESHARSGHEPPRLMITIADRGSNNLLRAQLASRCEQDVRGANFTVVACCERACLANTRRSDHIDFVPLCSLDTGRKDKGWGHIW